MILWLDIVSSVAYIDSVPEVQWRKTTKKNNKKKTQGVDLHWLYKVLQAR